MDGLELGMCETDLDEQGKVVVGMQETLQGGQRVRHVGRRRRHEIRVVQGAAGGADPVLGCPQFAGRAVLIAGFNMDRGKMPY